MTSAYIIGRYKDADRANDIAQKIGQFGVQTVSTWHSVGVADTGVRRAYGVADEIDRADIVISLAHKTNGGGAAMETGYAMGADKPVIIVGEAETILAQYAACLVRDDEEAVATIFGFAMGRAGDCYSDFINPILKRISDDR